MPLWIVLAGIACIDLRLSFLSLGQIFLPDPSPSHRPSLFPLRPFGVPSVLFVLFCCSSCSSSIHFPIRHSETSTVKLFQSYFMLFCFFYRLVHCFAVVSPRFYLQNIPKPSKTHPHANTIACRKLCFSVKPVFAPNRFHAYMFFNTDSFTSTKCYTGMARSYASKSSGCSGKSQSHH